MQSPVTRLIFWLGFATTVAFWPGIINAGTAPRWAVLAIGVPICLMLMDRRVDTRSWWPALILVCAAATLAWTPDLLNGIDAFIRLSILMGVFYLGTQFRSVTSAWGGIQWGVALMLPIVVLQWFNLISIQQAVAPAGLLMNKNMMGELALVAAVTALSMGAWTMFVCAIAICVLTTSKAVAGAFLLTLVVIWFRRAPYASLALGVMIVGAALVSFLIGMESAGPRLAIWSEAISNWSFFGNGLGSFVTTYPAAEYVHSEPIQFIYELGVFSIPLFAAFLYALGTPHAQRESIVVLVAVGAVSFFSFPLHMPVTAFAAALAAGHLAGCRNRIRNYHYDQRAALGVGA